MPTPRGLDSTRLESARRGRVSTCRLLRNAQIWATLCASAEARTSSQLCCSAASAGAPPITIGVAFAELPNYRIVQKEESSVMWQVSWRKWRECECLLPGGELELERTQTSLARTTWHTQAGHFRIDEGNAVIDMQLSSELLGYQ